MFPMLLLPFVFIVIVPAGLFIAFSFRRRHGCDACTATSYSCARLTSGKTCPFFD